MAVKENVIFILYFPAYTAKFAAPPFLPTQIVTCLQRPSTLLYPNMNLLFLAMARTQEA